MNSHELRIEVLTEFWFLSNSLRPKLLVSFGIELQAREKMIWAWRNAKLIWILWNGISILGQNWYVFSDVRDWAEIFVLHQRFPRMQKFPIPAPTIYRVWSSRATRDPSQTHGSFLRADPSSQKTSVLWNGGSSYFCITGQFQETTRFSDCGFRNAVPEDSPFSAIAHWL